MFDYTPVGVVVMLAGILFMVFIGRHLLPSRDIRQAARPDPGTSFDLHERLFVVHLPEHSVLDGKTLVESRLGAALGLNVVGIIREGRTELAPEPRTVLRSGDGLLVAGRSDQLGALGGQRHLALEAEPVLAERLVTTEVGLLEVTLPPDSDMVGRTLESIRFRQEFGGLVHAIRRKDQVLRTALDTASLEADDRLLVQAPVERLAIMDEDPRLQVAYLEDLDAYRLEERLMRAQVLEDSLLVGETLEKSRLGDAYALEVVGIERGGVMHMLPGPTDRLEAGDVLLLRGERDSLDLLEGLHGLEIDGSPSVGLGDLESEAVGLAEVVLSPYSRHVGKSLTQLYFREKYGLNVLAVWRGGRPIRSNLRHLALRLGDALLLHGPRQRLGVLGADPDFLVLAEEAQEAPNLSKAPVALGIMALVLVPVIAGWLPIAIAAVGGVVLMVVSRCLTMEEAYRAIEWKAVFLIAGMLPLGVAMEQTGAAKFLAEGVVAMVGGLGPMAILIALFVLAALASQVMPNPAVAVLLAPIAYNTAVDLGISPYPLMMTIAVSASAAFLSPVGHSANVLVMGPGGYRFSDYLKVGIPLTVVVLLVVVAVMPVFWPF
jgi:di/tricarboxylate transporter